MQGPAGVAGIVTFVMPAGETIFGHRVVRAINGQVFLADPTQPIDGGEVAGIALTAATVGQSVTVQPDNKLSDPSWTWTPGSIYVGLSGILTQTLPDPSSGYAWLMRAGTALSATDIIIDLSFIAEFT